MRVISWLALLSAVACSGGTEKQARPEMTQRQRDSALAASGLPGANVVGRALEVADSVQARRDREAALEP